MKYLISIYLIDDSLWARIGHFTINPDMDRHPVLRFVAFNRWHSRTESRKANRRCAKCGRAISHIFSYRIRSGGAFHWYCDDTLAYNERWTQAHWYKKLMLTPRSTFRLAVLPRVTLRN